MVFEFGRGIRRLLQVEPDFRPPRDGLAGGDAALLELMDLRLLRAEGRASDIAAGRIGARDRARRRLDAAVVWRETARRAGDAAALRKAAANAEMAADLFDPRRRPDGWVRARGEQGWCALLGAELFGDDGLAAAAEVAFRDARNAVRSGPAGALAEIGLLAVEARRELSRGDALTARSLSRRFDAAFADLEKPARRRPALKIAAAEARLMRAEWMAGFGARLLDEGLIREARAEAAEVAAGLDPDAEPLIRGRAGLLSGHFLTLAGEVSGEIEPVLESVNLLADVLGEIARDQSPLDWARAQAALGQALQALGEASVSDKAYDQAVSAYDRAELVLRDAPALALRAAVAASRATCLARTAELTGDLAVLDAAEAAFKIELSRGRPAKDPAAWALTQVNLAGLYEARIAITGRDRGERAAAALALSAALDVFGELGLRSMTALAADALARLEAAPAPRTV